ncbi:CPBP family intramembrane metalloprotease [Parabacteroides sp. AF48-14]|uniref:CPBP family intramembrane glutamic endopeptidase n=1 Tax=Parabacteroides sp. AF48-14 TaxID=2292052 RepID=UPI000F00B900|nr:type II CAAX endopeptidase family protein [Parabacteroides sp. AF48-14]RHO72541.1 CPBP family intramembrane metalloprotease [Parabacteroides sp. AF48-14]
MDRIVKLLLAQIGFVFLGILLGIPFFFFMEESLAITYMAISGLLLGCLFFIWYILSKKYVHFDSLTWSFRSMKVILLTVILNIVFFYFASGLDGLGNFLGYKDLDKHLNILRDISLSPFGLCVLILVSPVTEELLHRGAILSSLLEKKDLAPKYAIIISALIFGVIHPGHNISFFLFGLLWGYLYYRSGSLGLCVLSNMIVTALLALLVIYYPDKHSVYEMTGVMPFAGLLSLSVIVSAVCIYFLNRSLKAPAWQISEKTDGEIDSIVTNEESKE